MTILTRSIRRPAAAALTLAVALAGCKADLNLTNPNSATRSGASSDPSAFQLLATGLMVDQRGTRAGFIQNTGIFGREAYNYTPQEGRNTTHYLIGIVVGGVQKLDPTGFANGNWGGQYGVLRDLFNFRNTVKANATLSTAQKNAALGFAQTLEALMQFE